MNKDLQQLSLLAFVKIHQSFTGMFMADELRVWYVEVDVRLNPRMQFTERGESLDDLIKVALSKVVDYYLNYYPQYLDNYDDSI